MHYLIYFDMTNEEKANEICKKHIFDSNHFECCMEMAEWKEQQTKEALNNILIECDACFDEPTTNTLESIIKHQIEIL